MKNSLFLFSSIFLLVCVSNVFAAVKTWDGGGGADSNWMTAANWVGDVAPVANDDLVFPLVGNSTNVTANNNFPLQTTFRSIAFTGGSYTIGGNPFRLSDGLSAKTDTQMINTAITLTKAQTFTAEDIAFVTIAAVRFGGFTLTADGGGILTFGVVSDAGTLIKKGSGALILVSNFGFSGAINVESGFLVVDANLPNAVVTVNSAAGNIENYGALAGMGTVGATTVNIGAVTAVNLTTLTGVLNIQGNLIVNTNSIVGVLIQGAAPGSGYSQLNVRGTVTLNSALVQLEYLSDFRPAIGSSLTIINNDGTDAVIGTFANLPEGATVNGTSGINYRISYRGGDGNDVVLTRISKANFDFDGDGKSDIAVYRPSNGTWYENLSGNGSFTAQKFGAADDKIVPADYDGDGKTDIAVYRPSNGTWYVTRSSDNTFNAVQFGVSEDIPVPNDYDRDGKSDVAVFRPSNGTWYVMQSSNNTFFARQFGQSGDKPVVGDFDGDGVGDLAVFRAGTWYLLQSSSGFTAVQFGLATDIPTAADYDGDSKTDFAVYRPSNGTWYRLNSGSNNSFTAVQFGTAEDKTVPADYDGDGKSDVAVFRPSNGVWYLLRSTSGFTGVSFGESTDKPVPNAFIR